MKGKTASWWSGHELVSKLFFLLLLFLPTQLGKHFFPQFSLVSGLRVDYLSPTVYFTDLLSLSFITSCLLQASFRQFVITFSLQAKLLLLAVIVISSVATGFSSRPQLSLYGVMKLSEMVSLGICFSWYLSQFPQHGLRLLTDALLIGVCVESILAIWQYLHQASINGLWYLLGERYFTSQTPGIAKASIQGRLLLRPYATFPHPNVLAGYILVTQTIILFTGALTKKKWLVLILSSLSLILTMSRVVLVLWLVLVVIYFLLNYAKRLLPLVLGFLIFILVVSPFTERFFVLSDESTTIRVMLVKDAVAIFSAHPIVGVGLYNFIPSLSQLPFSFPTLFYLQPVHNIFLLVVTELGLLGLITFIWFFWLVAKRVIGQLKLHHYLPLILLCTVIIIGNEDHYFFTLQQGQLISALIFSLIFSSPTLFTTGGESAFKRGLRKNTRK